jgi:hypothetical protein
MGCICAWRLLRLYCRDVPPPRSVMLRRYDEALACYHPNEGVFEFAAALGASEQLEKNPLRI